MRIWNIIRRTMIATGLMTLGLMVACGGEEGAAIRATLSDGQVLYGSLRTTTLYLDGPMGRMTIPLSHVGEVVPVEGDELEAAEGHVKIWLRNGSELVGRWDEPELAMDIDVGGELVEVDLPVNDLQRVQTQGDELWPEGLVYRVRTTHGDDFLVDAEASKVILENDLGVFSPTLSECRSVRPIEDPDGDWRIELETGTVLIGNLADDELTLALPLGPEQVTVPLAILDSMEAQSWYFAETRAAPEAALERPADRERRTTILPAQDSASTGGSWMPWEGAGAAPAMAEPMPDVASDAGSGEDSVSEDEAEAGFAPAPTPAAVSVARGEPSSSDADGWFHRDALEKTKRSSE